MRIRLFGNQFVAACRFEERGRLRNAGWEWDNAFRKWSTKDVDKVRPFFDYTEGEARSALQSIKSREQEAIEASRATDTEFEPPVPDGLSYFPFQKAGISYGRNRKAVLIGDEPGLGKTIQAIGIGNCDPNLKRVLIVCEASHKVHWKREHEKWSTHGLSVGLAQTRKKRKFIDGYYKNGKPRWRNFYEKLVWPETDVVVINYDVLEHFIEQVRGTRWDLMICDEAHALKSQDSKRTRFVLGAERRSKRVGGKWIRTPAEPPIPARRSVFLTGTPIPNRPVELWPLIKRCDPSGLGKDYDDFVYRYCEAHTTAFGLNTNGASNLPELQRIMRERFMVRRKKMDVLKDLPPKRRNLIVLPSEGLEELIYNEAQVIRDRLAEFESMLGLTLEDHSSSEDAVIDLCARISEKVLDSEDGSYEGVLETLSEGEQVLFEEIAQVRQAIAMAKVPMVVDHIKEITGAGRKVIIFIYHKDVAKALKEHFPNAAMITGSVPVEKRQPEADRFQEDPECMEFIGQFTAAGKGFTLTAAHDVVCAELDWSPGNMCQAEDRAHRIGQTNFVNVDHLVLADSLEVRQAESLVEKQEVIEAALDKEDA